MSKKQTNKQPHILHSIRMLKSAPPLKFTIIPPKLVINWIQVQ